MKPDINKLAALAKLELTEEERRRLEPELSEMIAFAADCIGDGSAARSDLEKDTAIAVAELRPDEPGPTLPREVLLANAPKKTDKYFSVPGAIPG